LRNSENKIPLGIFVLITIILVFGLHLSLSAQNVNCSSPIVLQTLRTGICKENNVKIWTKSGENIITVRWEKKEVPTDGDVSTIAWTTIDPINQSGDSVNVFISQTTLIRKILVSNDVLCPELATKPIKIWFSPTLSCGVLSSPSTACYADNHAVLNLSNAQNNVIAWEQTTQNTSQKSYLNHTQTSLAYYDLTETTVFRALVQGCNSEDTLYSNPIEVTVTRCDTCLKPQSLEITNTKINSVSIKWKSPISGSLFEVFYRPINGEWHSSGKTNQESYTVSNLLSCQKYEVKVECICGQNRSDFISLGFSTITSISNFRITQITSNSAYISWDNLGIGMSAQVRYRVTNGAWITDKFSATNNRRLISLYSNVNYEVEIRTKCEGMQSNWKRESNFKTVSIVPACSSNIRPPDKISSTVLMRGIAIIRWKNPMGSKGVWLNYGIATQNPNLWKSVFVCAPADSTFLMNLISGQNYRYRIRTLCETCTPAQAITQSRKSGWSPILDLKIPPAKTESPNEKIIFSNFEIYPNPAQNHVYIKNINPDFPFTSGNISLFDINGKQIFKNSIHVDTYNAHTEQEINLENIPNGVYLLKLENEDLSLFFQTRLVIID